jgi:hypothetical protein
MSFYRRAAAVSISVRQCGQIQVFLAFLVAEATVISGNIWKSPVQKETFFLLNWPLNEQVGQDIFTVLSIRCLEFG